MRDTASTGGKAFRPHLRRPIETRAHASGCGFGFPVLAISGNRTPFVASGISTLIRAENDNNNTTSSKSLSSTIALVVVGVVVLAAVVTAVVVGVVAYKRRAAKIDELETPYSAMY